MVCRNCRRVFTRGCIMEDGFCLNCEIGLHSDLS